MKSTLFLGASALAISFIAACTTAAQAQSPQADQAAETQGETAGMTEEQAVPAEDNEAYKVLLEDWEGPYGGVPPFDKVEVSMLEPALETAIANAQEGIEETTSQSAAPTFENTILPLEEGMGELMRVATV